MLRGESRIGIIGSGVISEAYLRLAPNFRNLKIVACADIVPAAAKARARQYGVAAMPIDTLLADESIDTVINLTIPAAHYDVSMSILSAGKHAYSEKPLALNSRQAKKLVAEADKRGLKIGCAPDTFLGAGGQTARKLIDSGLIGKVLGGSAQVLSHGMEHWHPNPGFFFQPGAGPMLDVGPYYVTALVNVLGPVKTVAAMAKAGFPHRLVTAEGPMKGKKIKVTTPTNINAVLEFASGAQVTISTSWDVWKHGHINPIELYGEKGSMLMPDPNFFGGKIFHSERDGAYTEVDTAFAPFGAENFENRPGQAKRSNYRMLGVADLIDAARKKREPRCSGRLAAHVLEIMESTLLSAATRKFVTLKTTVERPKPLSEADAKRLSSLYDEVPAAA
jgi:predicted dehydrogenase